MNISTEKTKEKKLLEIFKKLGFVKTKHIGWVKFCSPESRLHIIFQENNPNSRKIIFSLHRDIGYGAFNSFHRSKDTDSGIIRIRKQIEKMLGGKNEHF